MNTLCGRECQRDIAGRITWHRLAGAESVIEGVVLGKALGRTLGYALLGLLLGTKLGVEEENIRDVVGELVGIELGGADNVMEGVVVLGKALGSAKGLPHFC